MADKKKTPPETKPEPSWRPCFRCGERFDPVKDPSHIENCIEAMRP